VTPTARTLRYLRDLGYYADVVERWIMFGCSGLGVRRDYCGFADIIAFHPLHKIIVAIQTTSTAVADRKKKLRSNQAATDWVRSGGHLWVVGWRKIKGKWTPRFDDERSMGLT